VCKEPYPDPTQFDKKNKYFDAKSDPNDPRWSLVDIEFVARFTEMVTLDAVRAEAALSDMELVRYGRLSVQAVRKAEFDHVKKMGGLK
jgi:predicted RNA-binding protein with PUA-like domain